MEVIVVSPPGRKRENLLTMLESINHLKSVKTADTFNDLTSALGSKSSVTVLVDYRYPEKQLERDVSSLILNNVVEHVVLLESRNAPKSHFTHYSTSEVVYDELTIGMLSSLLTNIALNASN